MSPLDPDGGHQHQALDISIAVLLIQTCPNLRPDYSLNRETVNCLVVTVPPSIHFLFQFLKRGILAKIRLFVDQ